MLIVGELINASRKAIATAIETQDGDAIKKVAQDEFEAGAHYIDVNAGVFVGREPEYLTWLVKTVQSAVEAPCCIDSPDPKAIEAALVGTQGNTHDQLHFPGKRALQQPAAHCSQHGHENCGALHERRGHARDSR